jgi:hypothetical protein
MRKLFFLFLTVFTTIFIASVSGSVPNWVLFELKKYPLDTYLFQVGMSQDPVKSEAFKEATAEADKKVAKRVLEKVVGIIHTHSHDLAYDIVKEHYSAVLEDYCSQRRENPALTLEGLSVRNLSVDMARTDKETYAFVYIKRDELKAIYAKHAARLQEKIQRQLEIARIFEEKLNVPSAVSTYLRTYPLYESLKEAEIIQIGAEYSPDSRTAFKNLADAATRTSDTLWSHRQVIRHVEELTNEVIVSFDDACRVINTQLSEQVRSLGGSVAVHPLIYEDSEMPSPLAVAFTSFFQRELKWTVIDWMLNFENTQHNLKHINQDFPRRLSPTCWENGDEVTIRAILRDVHTGEFLASAVVRYLKSQQREARTYKPRGYEGVMVEKETFKPHYYVVDTAQSDTDGGTPEVLIERSFSPIGGLEVDVWTGQGHNHVYYTEGDTVKIFASVNQPAYLRMLYTLADQRRTLLIDNFYIGPSEVNSPVAIGNFRCVPPLGTEFLFVAARTEEFPEMETRQKDGYRFLVSQDAETAAQSVRSFSTRGLVPEESSEQQVIDPQPDDNEQPRFQQSEAQLMLTIMKK